MQEMRMIALLRAQSAFLTLMAPSSPRGR